MSADKSESSVKFQPDHDDHRADADGDGVRSERDHLSDLTFLVPVSGVSANAAKPDNDKRLEAALAITELANSSPQQQRSGLLGGQRTTALQLVKGLIPLPVVRGGHPIFATPQALLLHTLATNQQLEQASGSRVAPDDSPMPRLKRKKRQPKAEPLEDGAGAPDGEKPQIQKKSSRKLSKRNPTLKELIESRNNSEDVTHMTTNVTTVSNYKDYDDDNDDYGGVAVGPSKSSLVLKPEALEAFMHWQKATTSSAYSPPPNSSQPSSSKKSIILQSPDQEVHTEVPNRILPEIPKSISTEKATIAQQTKENPGERKKINLRLRSLSAVRSLYEKPTTKNHRAPSLGTKSCTALGRIMARNRHLTRPEGAGEERNAEMEEDASSYGFSPPHSAPSPQSEEHEVEDEEVPKRRTRQSEQSPPRAPSSIRPTSKSRLPPKKRKFVPSDSPESAPNRDEQGSSRRPQHVDPGRNLAMLQDCQIAVRADEDGDLPVHIAVVQGKVKLVEQLLAMMKRMGVSVDKSNALLQTPLHLALLTAQMTMVRMLLSAGASVNQADRHGNTALHLGVKHLKPLDMASVIRDGCNLNARNYQGITALHMAVDSGCLESVRVLVKHSVDVDIVEGKGGRSALFLACERKDHPMVKELIAAQANVQLTNYAGVSPVQVASMLQCFQIVVDLVECGADNPSGNMAVLNALNDNALNDDVSPEEEPSPEKQASSQVKRSPKQSIVPRKSKRRKSLKDPSAIVIGETSAVADITSQRTSFDATADGSPPIVLVASGSPRGTGDLEESVPSVKDVIEAMQVAMRRLGEKHPHYKVLQQRLKHFKLHNKTPYGETKEVEEQGEEKVLPSIQLPSVRTSLRKKLKRKIQET